MSAETQPVVPFFRVSGEKKRLKADQITVLHRSRWLQHYIGLGSYQPNEERFGWIRVFILTSLMISVVVTSSINLFRYATNMDIAAGLLFAFCIYMIWMGSYLTVVIKRNELQRMLTDIQKVFNERTEIRKDAFYENREKDLNRFTWVYFTFTLGSVMMYAFVPFLIVLYDKLNERYSIDSWSLHYNNVWLPFDVNSVKRYIMVNFVQTMACWNGTTSCIAVVSIFFGVVYYIEAYFIDIKHMFDEMDRMSENESSQFMSHTRSAIILHTKILDLYQQLRSVMNWIVLFTFAPVVLAMCGSAMQMNNGISIFGAILTSISVGYLLIVLLAYCYFGNHLTDSLLNFTTVIYEAQWYNYPIELQKMFIIVMNTAQQPIYITAFGLMLCTLENYGQVLRCTVSAFMVLRSFT